MTSDVTPAAAFSATLDDAEVDELRPAFCVLVAPLSVLVAALALGHLAELEAIDWTCAALVVAWAVGGAVVGVRRRADRLGPIMLAGGVIGALGMLAAAFDHPLPTRVALGLLPAVALHLLLSLPDGRLHTPARRNLAIVAYVVGAAVGVVAVHDAGDPLLWPFAVLWLAALVVGLPCANQRYRHVGPADRRRMQWVGWSLAVCAELLLVVVALRLIAGWPPAAPVVVIAGTILIPVALVAGTHVTLIARVDRLLTDTIALAGLTALVVALGRSIRDEERSLLLLSMAAAVLAALVYLPVRARLTDAANQLVYGDRVAPDEALRTWGTRLTRAIPLDELLLQLSESLRKSMSLRAAEIFTGTDGRYELTAGVPHREVE